MPRKRDYKAEYAARKARAISQGYKGYGQKRYQEAKAKREHFLGGSREQKIKYIGDLIHQAFPPSAFDENGLLDRDRTDAEIKRALYATFRRHGRPAAMTDDDINFILLANYAQTDRERWDAFRVWYEANILGTRLVA